MTTTADLATEIRYNRETRDYDILHEGRYIGSRSTYSQADEALREYTYDLLTSGETASATELDGGTFDQ